MGLVRGPSEDFVLVAEASDFNCFEVCKSSDYTDVAF